MMLPLTFQVNYEPRHKNEVVCITGGHSTLGCWSPLALQPMTKDISESRWTCIVEAAEGTVIKYRYAVCSYMHSSAPHILQWETNLSPRQICVSDKPCCTGLETFGKCGECSVQRGPLIATREIRLMFEKVNFTKLISSLNCSQCRLSIKAVDATNSSIAIPVLVHNLSGDDFSPRPQADHGEMLETSSDVLLFSTQGLPTSHEVKFIIQLIRAEGANNSTKDSPKRLKREVSVLAECGIMSNTLINSVGKVPLYFFDDPALSLGHVMVSYAVIEPMDTLDAHSLEVSYTTHWRRRKALNIGHRGMGRSHKDHSLIHDPNEDELVSVPENTIYSLKEAANHGADFVEFDVHVTKDGFPVLFHDFQFSLCMQEPGSSKNTRIAKLAIKDMTLEQLAVIRKLAPVGRGTTDFLCETITSIEADALAFSQLQTALETVPVHCGFDIEIKYPMIREKSGPEYDGTPMDMNQSLDAILRVVLKYGGQRRIFFSAFNPDVCAMIRLKQSKYPVMMCNFGRTTLYESYTDPRSVSVENSILTSCAYQILGLCGHCEDYIKDPSLVKACHSNGLTLMCWGEGTVDPGTREKLSEIGVDGVIHDRMASFPSGTKNTFESKKALKYGST